MAKFGPEVTEAPALGSSTTVREGLTSQPLVAKGITNLFDKASEIVSAKRAGEGQKFVSSFTNDQLALVQAVDQGVYNSQFARTKIRANLMQAINNYPSLRDDILAANKDILGSAGMGSIITDGTKEEIREERLTNTLVQEGYIDPNANEASVNAAKRDYAAAEAAKRGYEQRKRALDEEKSQVGLSKSRLELLDAQQNNEAEKLLTEIAPHELNKLNTTFDTIINNPEFGRAEKVQGVETAWAQFEAEVASVKQHLSSSQADALFKGFELRKEVALKRASGEFSDSAIKAEIDAIVDFQKWTFLNNDPEAAKVVAISELSDQLALNIDPKMLKVATRFMNGGLGQGSMPSVLTADKEEGKGLKGFTDILNNVDDSNPAKVKERDAHIGAIMKSISTGEGILKDDPRAGKTIVDWLSSEGFNSLLDKAPDAFGNLDKAKEILQSHYADEVWGMVQRQFTSRKVLSEHAAGIPYVPGQQASGDSEPISSNVIAKSSTNGVVFEPADPSNVFMVEEARKFNKDLAPVINKTVRAFAHLEGRTDYAKVYEEASASIFSGGGQDQDPQDDLQLEDFVFPTINDTTLPSEVQADTEFLGEVDRLSEKYEIDPSVLMSVMHFETKGTFNPAKKNEAGSSGTGLIQFMADTAKALGTDVSELAAMSRVKQMRFVEKYLDQFASKIKGGSAEDVYMVVLFPKAMKKPNSYVLFRKGTLAYRQNKGLDRNGDGTVTKAEAARKVVGLVGQYESS